VQQPVTFPPNQVKTDRRWSVQFRVGEKVVYPNQGISIVEAITSRAAASGEADPVYELRVLSNDSRVFVSQNRASDVGLRPVVKASEVRRIYDLLGDGRIQHQGNWKGRFKENSDKMRTGSLIEVAAVLKGLTFLSKKKSLSFREKFMLERARFLIVSEIAEVEGKPSTVIEERIDQVLSKSVGTDPRAVARADARGRAREV
jgi:CarD family transcriptional regulator